MWELSVEKNLTAKADLDYKKRDTTPDGSPTLDAVYVEAILRVWGGREGWANGKRGDRRWKDVRAYGVDDVEAWLESAPVTHAWISELLGFGPYGYRAAESWWRDWASATTPALPLELVTAGRGDAVASLKVVLTGPPALTTVRGGSMDDILGFIAAALHTQARDGDPRWRSRAAIVDDRASWRALVGRANPLILIPQTREVAVEATTGTPHHVLVPVLGSASPDIDLPPIDSGAATAALKAAGLKDQRRSEAAGRLARRSLMALRRNLASKPELHRPAWADTPSRTLRGVLLAGRWDERLAGDMSAVADLTGQPYDMVRETLAGLARERDPLVSQLGSVWVLTSAQDAWIQLREAVRRDDLDRLGRVVRQVLLEADPALDLAPEERWRAGVHGTRHHSIELRHGLAATLALLGVHGSTIETDYGSDARQWVAHIVRELLAAANADLTGSVWNALQDVLPRLAEAAPDAFLNGVRDATIGEHPIIKAMFTDAGQPGAMSSSPHSSLLWALESLAWSPEHFGQTIQLLARLTEIDPGGRLSNRPAASLKNILCPWHPETSATAVRRLAAVDAMRLHHPDVAWTTMLALLPSSRDVHFRTPDPEFREWKQHERTGITMSEWMSFTEALVERLSDIAGDSPVRWQQFLDRLPDLPPECRERLLGELARRVTERRLSRDGRLVLWEALRAKVARHRTYADTHWALPHAEVDALEAVAQALAPVEDPVALHAWLFADQLPDLGDATRRDDLAAYDAMIAARRVHAVAEIDANGFDGVRKLAATAAVPNEVGAALAEAVGDKHLGSLLDLLASEDHGDAGLAWGWLTRRFQRGGWDWAQGILGREIDADQRAHILLATRDYPKAWEAADEFGSEVAAAFWRRFRPYGLGADFAYVRTAGERLTQAGRVTAALKLASLYIRHSDRVQINFLIAVLREFLANHGADSELGSVDQYDLQQIFHHLNTHAALDQRDEIAKLEWAFLPALGFEPKIGALEEAIASDPDFFSQIINAVYPPDDLGDADADADADADDGDGDGDGDGEPELDPPAAPEQVHLAENGYQLLMSLRRLPGLRPDGTLDATALRDWVMRVLHSAAESGRRDIAALWIGQVLANAPESTDGTWPCEPVRDLLEELQDQRIESGLEMEVFNRRGVTSRGLEDGGGQEAALADKYRAQAHRLADAWPRTAAVLRSLAGTYDADARREEGSAERVRRGLDR